jgi:pimeloyl-ACP methyl ester carboxylesterase
MTQLLDVKLPQGTIRYRDVGRGPVLLFVHGLLVSGSVWRKVVAELSDRYRCIVPDWPVGSHTVPMNADADLTPAGIAELIADFTEALGLDDVTLVGNDSGGALCQLVVAHHPERVGRLVLTTCDAFEIFPPALFSYLKVVTYIPGVMPLLGKSMMLLPFLRRLPIAYGAVSKRPIPNDVLTEWVAPSANSAAIRRDLSKFIRGVSPRVTMEVSKLLPRFGKPVLLAWSPQDRFFPITLAERLERTFPDARIVRIDDSFVFAQEDNPAAVANAIAKFVPAVEVQRKSRTSTAA